ncbi:ImpA domain-containing protein [Caballeronia udeis]|uniref:ImpA domain-containing protein n=1 Tax=Caballeronia udeis TaxID=1232866 RepID=A0A158FXB5_9BURK|nr:type VI secretion system protein TssA [Caballeronia udeis]SAL24494.1 ImpA domain-containing protein [Caballeronia udeis]
MKLADTMDLATPAFDVDLESLLASLLAPVAGGEGGAGISLRYDPVYQRIRDARHQDDATLPMGEWERPLIKADWKTVAALCSDALGNRSKDFQLAAWLCEAWTHLHRIDGFVAGTRLLAALVERYWDHAWPRVEDEDDDVEVRIAPFVWMNDAFSLMLSLHVPLMAIDGREPAEVNLDDWQRVLQLADDDASTGSLTRDLLSQHLNKGRNLANLMSLHQQLDGALGAWRSLTGRVDERLHDDGPNLSRVSNVLARLARATASLLGEHALPQTPPGGARDKFAHLPAAEPANAGEFASAEQEGPLGSGAFAGDSQRDAEKGRREAMAALPDHIESRAHAYRLIEIVARYLEENEPHSPTPYLLKRAVSWGQMPLADLMREIVRTEGDLTRYLALLGLER